MRIRVLLVSEAQTHRESVERGLAGCDAIELLETARSAEQASRRVRRLLPDIVLLDMAMPGALGVARDSTRSVPGTRVVALADLESEPEVMACAEAGVTGYVPRLGPPSEAIEVITAVARGQVRCSTQILGWLIRRIAMQAAERRLTARETEIRELLQQGLTNRTIARRLGIEPTTVKNHVHSVLAKLGVHRRTEAALRPAPNRNAGTVRKSAAGDPSPTRLGQ